LESGNVYTKQQRIAELGRRMADVDFTSLAYYIDLEWMYEAYRRTRKDGSAGVDDVTAEEYEKDLDGNLRSLLERFKSGRYVAPPVKRVYIPKGDGRVRPIGIPTLEDKILQRAVVMLLTPLYEQDARRVWEVLPKRFGKYGLALHEEKTLLLDFHRPKGGGRKPETFVFLGFTHYWGKSRKGKWVMKRKTAAKKLKAAVQRVYGWCKKHRHDPVKDQWQALCGKLIGHYGFYGVTFNSEGTALFYEQVKRSWRKWLNRRSRDNDMPWERFNRLLEHYPLPKPRIAHKFAQ